MRHIPLLASCLLVGACCHTLSGCSGPPPVSTSMVEATVSGTVTINGKLATEGEVEFDPANYLRKMEPARRAPISADGRYTIRTLLGQNIVRFVSFEEPTERGMAYDSIEFDVKEGENTLDIRLPLNQ